MHCVYNMYLTVTIYRYHKVLLLFYHQPLQPIVLLKLPSSQRPHLNIGLPARVKHPYARATSPNMDGFIAGGSLYNLLYNNNVVQMTTLGVMSFRVPRSTRKHGVRLEESDRPKVVKKLKFSKEFEVSYSKSIMLSALMVSCIYVNVI